LTQFVGYGFAPTGRGCYAQYTIFFLPPSGWAVSIHEVPGLSTEKELRQNLGAQPTEIRNVKYRFECVPWKKREIILDYMGVSTMKIYWAAETVIKNEHTPV